jgi:hypothetical protein
MTPEQIEQLKRERAIAINALADIADFTIDYKAKQLAEQTIQRIKQ